jgi:hypothetical protein
MLSPSVGGTRAKSDYLPAVCVTVGALAGGVLLGVALGVVVLVTSPLDAVRAGILWGLVAVAVVALLVPQVRPWLPQRRCQVGGNRLRQSGASVGAAVWGFELGLGVRTYLVTPAFYGMAALQIGLGSPALALVASATYGLSRGAAIASAAILIGSRKRRGVTSGDVGLGLEPRSRPLLAAVVTGAAVLTSVSMI